MVRTGFLLAVLLASALQDRSASGQWFDNNPGSECLSAVSGQDPGSASGQDSLACEVGELADTCDDVTK